MSLKFAQVEGKLQGLETVIHHIQSETRILTGKLQTDEEKIEQLEVTSQNHNQELQAIEEDIETKQFIITSEKTI